MSPKSCDNLYETVKIIDNLVECKRNVMAHAQKPDSVFKRNGRVHLYRRVCQFSRVLAFLECGSGENDCSNTGRTVPSQTEACLATHSIRLFPLHFSSRASPCATRFRFHSNKIEAKNGREIVAVAFTFIKYGNYRSTWQTNQLNFLLNYIRIYLLSYVFIKWSRVTLVKLTVKI